MKPRFSPWVLWLLVFSHPLWGQTASAQDEVWDRDRLVSAAMTGNSGYLLSESRGREARSVLSAAKAARLPVIRFGSNLSYILNPPELTIKAGSFFPGGSIPVVTNVPPMTTNMPFPALPQEDTTLRLSESTQYEFSLSLEQPVFTWGRIHNSVKAADLGSRAAVLEMEQEKRNIRTTLDGHLYTLSFLTEIRGLRAEQRRCAERLSAISEESYTEGFLLQGDLLSIRLLSSELALGDYQIMEAWESSFQAIKTLTGLSGLTPSQIKPPFREGLVRDSLAFSREDTGGLLAKARAENVGLKLLALRTQAADRLLAASKGQYYGKPELGLFLQVTYAGPNFPFIQRGWKTANNLSLTTTVGIRSLLFDGGNVHHTIRQKEETLVQARLAEEQSRRELEAYLEKALLSLEVSAHRREYLSLKIEASQVQRDTAEAAWKSGYGEERDYLTQEISWREDRISLLQEELNALITALQLENVTGF
ncbi:TolC family protein [Treponema sp. TIM-1]|uniref:TolC family protein n=1 Tax=Treponema sp. TIM-1 TaxID=2898417 RepID=UPI00397F9E5B